MDPISTATGIKAAKKIWEAIPIIKNFYSLYKKHAYPKARSNATGFIIGILSDQTLDRNQIKLDFIRKIDLLLSNSRAKKPFQVIELSENQIEKIKTSADVKKVLDKCRSKFIIWGTVLKRNEDGKSFIFLDLHTGIIHNEIVYEISNILAKEMSELLPSRRRISLENDLKEFELNATNIDLAARYIIAEASLLSGDKEYSIELLEELHIQLTELQKLNYPHNYKQFLKHLFAKVNLVLAATHLRIAQELIGKWTKTRKIIYFDEMLEHLKIVDSLLGRTYESDILWSLYYFVVKKDIKSAHTKMDHWRNLADATWAFNKAFLFAYQNNMQSAMRFYNIAFRRESDSKILLQIEDFLEWILSENPDKPQFYFCLGLINYKGKNEYSIAKEDFENFLSKTFLNQFVNQRKMAEKYLLEIEKKKAK